MLPRRVYFRIALLVGLFAAGIAAARYLGQHQPAYYNCLYLPNGPQVELDAHRSPIEIYAASPDGNDVLGSIPLRGSNLMFIENTQTGKRSPIQWVPFIQPVTVRWSPDSEEVYYSWRNPNWEFHGSLFSRHTQQLTNIDLDFFYGLGQFSADKKYVVLQNSNSWGMILSLRDHPPTVDHTGIRHEWSPTGNRVAYYSEGELVVADLDQGTTAQTTIPHTESTTQFAYVPIRWSANARYLSVELSQSEPYFIDIFSIENSTPTLFAEIRIELGQYARWTAYWPQNESQFAYIIRTDEDTYELWSFDLETQQRQLVIPQSELKAYLLDAGQLVTLRQAGNSLLLEYRDTDITTPRYVREFQNNRNLTCGWWWYGILQCSGLIEDPGLILLDENGQTIWPTDDLPANTRVENFHYSNFNTSLYYPSATFLLSQGNHRWFEIVSFETRQTYRVPEWITDALPGETQTAINYRWPGDTESWLVYFDDHTQFRFWPAQDAWERVEHPHPLGIWSPDGKRVAVLTNNAASGTFDLFVQEADNSKQWSLGTFPGYMATGIHWSQCGDIFAPIWDDRAAQKP